MNKRYRIYPEMVQVAMLERHCADARFVWNLALEQSNLYRRDSFGPTPNPVVRQNQLAEVRKDTWLGDGSSSVQQVALRDFDQAMRNWWSGTHQRPTWRVKGLNESSCVRDVRIKQLNRQWATIFVPKLGPVHFRLSCE
jgi:putative transposase